MIKIGIVHFDGIHIVPHFVGSVAELYKDPECEVEILTQETNQDYLYSLLTLLDVPHSIVKRLPTYLYKKIAYKIQGRTKPSNQYIFKKHAKRFANYDVLVFNVFSHMHIKRKARNPKFVMLMHGAGDSHYPFTKEFYEPISRFDLITTAGEKINDLFNTMDKFPFTKQVTCGYQKLDVVRLENKDKKLFNNDNPIVLFNPHFKSHVTSYHKFGKDILEYFFKNKDFNLVFAPHVNLFNDQIKNPITKRSEIDQKYINADNIIVDFGSVNAVNMTYTMAADVYMGDASSQVYEFLITETKPCIFLDANNIKWEDDIHYQNWRLGKVLTEINRLDELLRNRETWQKEFEEKQKKAIKYTFDLSDKITSSKRVANAIKKLAQNTKND